MPKDEPWFKPRANEDDDDAMLDAKFGRGSGGGHGSDGNRHNRSCMWVMAVGGGVVTALAALGTAGARWLV